MICNFSLLRSPLAYVAWCIRRCCFGHSGRSAFILLFACLFSFLATGCASKKTIINSLDEREANEIVVFLSSKGIDAYKLQAKSEGPGGGGGAITFDIAVDSDKSTDAMALLSANGLPRRRTQRLLELFNASGLVPSEMQEKIRFQAGLADQIAGTIRKIDGILDADIQLSFPEEDPLNPTKKLGVVTASVFVKHQGVLDDPNSQLTTKIRRLVASSVQGLNFENVTVISDKGRFSDPNIKPKMRSGTGNIELEEVWGIVLAKDSVARFQFVFVAILFSLLLSSGFVLWLFWKTLPVARAMGGISALFSFDPLIVSHGASEIEPHVNTDDQAEVESKGKSKTAVQGKKAQENVESS